MSAVLDNVRRLLKKPPVWDWVQDMYLAGNDCVIAMRLLDGQQYEPQSRKLWKSICANCGPEDIVIDVGAHTGRYSLDAWEAGAKKVVSIEPYHLNFARLVMNLHHSGFPTHLCVYAAAGEM